ncbi:MAG: acyltransferase [Ferruginibacter sp.]
MNPINRPTFLGYLHSFRGFAIINIVAIHAIGLALFISSNNPKDPFSIANELLFHNSTIYFAVISGLLFSVVLKSKGYKKFYSSKFKNVLLPYLFLTLLFSIFNPTENNFFALHTDLVVYLRGALRNFIYGKAQFPYWYIPVLIFLYLVTPLLDYIMNIKKWGSMLIMLIILLPLAISRVELIDIGNKDSLYLSTMIYFTGAYAAGMYFGANPEERFEWVKKNMLLFILITVISSVAIIYFEFKNVDKFGAWSLRGTMFYIQKMCLSGIFIIVFKNRRERQPGWLGQIASYAFTIYFLHAFFLFLLYGLWMSLSPMHIIAPFNIFVTSLIFIILSIAWSILFGWIFKKLFGKYSRMLVGS